jgi:hypothetical protein
VAPYAVTPRPYAPAPYSASPRPPYAPDYQSYAPTAAPYGGAHHPLKDSSVHRNPYDSHDNYDQLRTEDADLAPHNPYSAPHGYTPYQYDMAKVPECAYANKQYYNLTFCLQDDYYPTETIQYELERNQPLVDRLLSDVTYQSADNLVDGLTRAEEEGYTYEHYYGANHPHQHYGADYAGYTYSPDYYKEGGYVCPSDIFYGRPKRAVNTYGKWKVVVNLPDEYYAQGYGKGYEKYTQTQRLEQCMYPGAPCSFVDTQYHSQCLQKHNFIRLLAYTYEEGLHIDSFKMPVACSCHVAQPQHYAPAGYGQQPKTPAYAGVGYPQQQPPYAG